MKQDVMYVFDLGGENFSISRPAPSEDEEIWNVHDSGSQFFAEFDAPFSDMDTEEKARLETILSLVAEDLICCICNHRTDGEHGSTVAGLCTNHGSLAFDEDYDYYEMDEEDDLD